MLKSVIITPRLVVSETMKAGFLSGLFVRSRAEANPGDVIFCQAFFGSSTYPEGPGISSASEPSGEVVLLFDDAKTAIKGSPSFSLLHQQHCTWRFFFFCAQTSFLARTTST